MSTEQEQVHLCFFLLCLCAYGELDRRVDPVSSCTHNSSRLCGLCSHERALPNPAIPLLSLLVTSAVWVAYPGFFTGYNPYEADFPGPFCVRLYNAGHFMMW